MPCFASAAASHSMMPLAARLQASWSGRASRPAPFQAMAFRPLTSFRLKPPRRKLVCLSYPGTGANAAHVRYLVRRFRRLLPEGATVLVGFWADEGGGAALKALEATAEADGYVISLKEAARFCIDAARGHDRRARHRRTTAPPRMISRPRTIRRRRPIRPGSDKAPARVA